MTKKRYQVFISSTYEDLKDERRAVEETIIRAGDFPVGMEAFPAADEEQFEFIKTIISQCDYYVLIISGRYGSITPDGKSYTEKEYDYAVEIGVPILVMLREERQRLPADKTELEAAAREKLDDFIITASTGRLRKNWSTIDGLKLSVREALDHAKATKARPGWIRGDQSASMETLEKLVAMQDENEELKRALTEATSAIDVPTNVAGLGTHIEFLGRRSYKYSGQVQSKTANFQISTSLGEIFELLAPHLMAPKMDSSVGPIISKCLWERHNSSRGTLYTMNDDLFQTVKIQFIVLKLISVSRSRTTKGGISLFWYLTELGKQEMIRRRTITTE